MLSFGMSFPGWSTFYIMYKLIPTGQNTVHLSQLLCLVKLNININNGTKTKWRLRCKRSHSIGHFNHFKNKQLNETNEEKKILITEKHSVKKNQAKQICIQSEKLTSFYGKTQREIDMGNLKVFAADMPAGPASFQKPLFIGYIIPVWLVWNYLLQASKLSVYLIQRSVATTTCSVQLHVSVIEINTLFNRFVITFWPLFWLC